MGGPALRAAVRWLAAPGGGLPGRLRRRALGLALPALLRRHHLADLLEALDAPGPGAAPAPGAGRRVLAALRRRRTTCLYRALAGFASLRAAGDPVQLLIGVRTEAGELVAHAWLERDGRPLGEPEDPRSRYAVAFAYPAAARGPAAAEAPMDVGQASADVILTELQDGTGVLLDLRTKFYFTLNRTGVATWKLLAAGAAPTAAALAARLAADFAGADPAAVERDVEALLTRLQAEGLLAPRGEGR